MAFATRSPVLSLSLWLLLVLVTATDDHSTSLATQKPELILSEHLTNITETLDNDAQPYHIETFAINQASSQISLVIQHNSVPLIQDSSQRGNLLLAIDHTRIYLTPLNKQLFNWFGLYHTKIFYEQNHHGIGGPRSIAFDWIDQSIYFSQDNSIQKISLCHFPSHNTTIVLRRSDDTQILFLEMDPLRKRLCWLESSNVDHYRLVVSDINQLLVVHVLHESNGGQCSAMTLDLQQGQLYWVDNGQLFRKSYNDQQFGKKEILIQHKDLIVDRIRIVDNYLYYTSMQQRLVRIRIQPTGSKPDEIVRLREQAHFIVSFHVTFIDNNGSNALEQCSLRNATSLNIEMDIGDFLQALWSELSHYRWNNAKQVAPIILACAMALTIHLCLYLAFCCARGLSR